jgi:hypothetical protein
MYKKAHKGNLNHKKIETMKSINNESELIELIKDNQTSIYNILNNRMYVKGTGHSQVVFNRELKDMILKLACNVIGGNKRLSVRRFLAIGTYRHYALERIFIEGYDNKISVSYCAGQDYRGELQDLRNFIYKVV